MFCVCLKHSPLLQRILSYFAEFGNSCPFCRGVIDIPKEIREIGELSDYAVQTRYPGDYAEISREEYNKAIELAERAYNWAEKSEIPNNN
ncbi:MAG: HEPN domain-containing protein [Spirochaetales bacterium]|nr:HEPN domain-containing protein [Spirochaetales bacterium]